MDSQDQTPDPDATTPSPEVVDEPTPDAEAPIDASAEPEAAELDVAESVTGEPGAEVGPTPEEDRRSPEELRVALAAAEARAEEYLDGLRRERAEFENFRRRSAKERSEALDRGAEQLAGNLLAVLDNFGYVLAGARESSDEQLAKGAEMVHAELLRVLGDAGLEQVARSGVPFDPTVHEAVSQVAAEGEVDAPEVAEVLRAGYRFKERVLRPASVTVAQ